MLAEAASANTNPELPRKFGRYALFDFIGKGGMAEIYLARARTELGVSRLCVVKQILPGLAEKPEFAEMLIHEAKLAARLNHANIVQVFDLGRADGRLFIAMDYIEGFDLNKLLQRCSREKVRLPLEFALLIVSDALRGLGYAHRRIDEAGRPLGIVHRDVSPSNVLVSLEGGVKLCDFGIARATELAPESAAAEDNPRDESPGAADDEPLQGKAGYMSPEHARHEKVDARSDIFAIGIVLWELLAGRRMYRVEPGQLSLLEQAKLANVPELPARGYPNEDALRVIVHKALAVDREARFPTAQAMLRELESYMATARLIPSPIRLGEWLVDTFGSDIVTQRRALERALAVLEEGAEVPIETLPPPPAPLLSVVPSPLSSSSDPNAPPNLSSTPPPSGAASSAAVARLDVALAATSSNSTSASAIAIASPAAFPASADRVILPQSVGGEVPAVTPGALSASLSSTGAPSESVPVVPSVSSSVSTTALAPRKSYTWVVVLLIACAIGLVLIVMMRHA